MFYYRLTRKAPLELVDFLQRAIFAYTLGKIKFTDGQNAIKFCKTPTVMRSDKWELRDFPSIVVGGVRGEPFPMSINKDFVEFGDDGRPVHGSWVEMTMPVSCFAETRGESNDLADFVIMMLLRPDAKDYLFSKGIEIPKPPSLDGDMNLKTPTTEFGLWQTDIGVFLNFHWLEIFDEVPTLLELFVDPEFVLQFEAKI